MNRYGEQEGGVAVKGVPEQRRLVVELRIAGSAQGAARSGAASRDGGASRTGGSSG